MTPRERELENANRRLAETKKKIFELHDAEKRAVFEAGLEAIKRQNDENVRKGLIDKKTGDAAVKAAKEAGEAALRGEAPPKTPPRRSRRLRGASPEVAMNPEPQRIARPRPRPAPQAPAPPRRSRRQRGVAPEVAMDPEPQRIGRKTRGVTKKKKQ
jgi:hypothetical protein